MSAMVECSAPCEVALEAFHPGHFGHVRHLHQRVTGATASSPRRFHAEHGVITDRGCFLEWVDAPHRSGPARHARHDGDRRAGSIAEWIKQRRPWGSLHAQCRFHGRWYVQVYADSPARLTLYFQDLPGALMPESK